MFLPFPPNVYRFSNLPSLPPAFSLLFFLYSSPPPPPPPPPPSPQHPPPLSRRPVCSTHTRRPLPISSPSLLSSLFSLFFPPPPPPPHRLILPNCLTHCEQTRGFTRKGNLSAQSIQSIR